MTVLLDGGVRRGVGHSESARARRAGGADGTRDPLRRDGRGEAGARHALEILSSELERSMKLCGARSVADIKLDLIKLARSNWTSKRF